MKKKQGPALINGTKRVKFLWSLAPFSKIIIR